MTFRYYKSARSLMSPNFTVLSRLGWTVQWASWEWCSYSCAHPDISALSYVETVYTVVPFFHWEWNEISFLDGHGFIEDSHLERYVFPFVPVVQGRLFRDVYEDEFSHLDAKGKRLRRRIRRS